MGAPGQKPQKPSPAAPIAANTPFPEGLDTVEELADDFLERRRRGETPAIEDYAGRYPKLADEIRDLFPAIVAMEQLKDNKSAAPGGPVLGGLTTQQMGDFRILREIGRGGMGIVYEAEQLSLNRRVAVKVLPRQAVLNPKYAARFQREARTAANLHHANIVPVYGAGVHDGFHYIVMQYISGVGLDRILNRLSQTGAKIHMTPAVLGALFGDATVSRSSRMRAARRDRRKEGGVDGGAANYWQTVAWIGLQVARALEYAHELGTLHRDIKPENIMITKKGEVKVADFGLAQLGESNTE